MAVFTKSRNEQQKASAKDRLVELAKASSGILGCILDHCQSVRLLLFTDVVLDLGLFGRRARCSLRSLIVLLSLLLFLFLLFFGFVL